MGSGQSLGKHRQLPGSEHQRVRLGCIFPFTTHGTAQAGVSASQGFMSLGCPRLVQGCSLVPQDPPQPLHPRGWGQERQPLHTVAGGV